VRLQALGFGPSWLNQHNIDIIAGTAKWYNAGSVVVAHLATQPQWLQTAGAVGINELGAMKNERFFPRPFLTFSHLSLLYAGSTVLQYSQLLKNGCEFSLNQAITLTGDYPMTINRLLHIIVGALILISLALAHYTSPKWLYFTVFVGVNLFQSGFTNWCLLATILKKLGAPETAGQNH